MILYWNRHSVYCSTITHKLCIKWYTFIVKPCFITSWINEWYLGLSPSGPMHLGLKTGPLYPMFCTKLEKPCSLVNFQMAPVFSFLISSGTKKKEPRYKCLSEAKASHSKKNQLRFPPQYCTSYKLGYRSAPLHINVISGCCVQLEDQWQPWTVSY